VSLLNAIIKLYKQQDIPTDCAEAVSDCLERVFVEMKIEGLALLLDPRFQLAVLPYAIGQGHVWAYYPVYLRRRIAKHVGLRPSTRVLLVICEPDVKSYGTEKTLEELRHHLGHALRYLRGNNCPNDCPAANKEWKKWSSPQLREDHSD
jgi:hypothetical protein